jgi:uncharacterized membrane protein/membrane-bound inhibitor of C-type lysozyme
MSVQGEYEPPKRGGKSTQLRALGPGALILVLSVACVESEKSTSTVQNPSAPPKIAVYDCADGRQLLARFPQDSDEMLLSLGNETRRLPLVRAASGAKYSDDSTTFWGKGREASLDFGQGPPIRCVENRRRSILEDARARGIRYRGVGNEPGWSIEIGSETTTLITQYGEDRFEFPTPSPTVDVPSGRQTFSVDAGGRHVVVVITDQNCNDTMSDDSFESTVEIALDGKTLCGCGTVLSSAN